MIAAHFPDTIHLLPYRPLSIASTAHVRKRMCALTKTTKKRVIMIPYPSAVNVFLDAALEKLPANPSIITSKRLDNDTCSYMPVFINHPPVEAIRFAREHQIELAFSGKHAVFRNAHEQWFTSPVDDAVLEYAPEKDWANAVGRYRTANDFHLRERYDFNQIFHYAVDFEEVILLVPVMELQAMRMVLSAPLPDEEPVKEMEQETFSSEEELIYPLDERIKQKMLGPIPGFAEIYEKQRRNSDGARFSYWNALFHCIAKTESQFPHLSASVTQQKAFAQLLMQSYPKGNTPFYSIDRVITCARPVFGDSFTNRLRKNLLTFFTPPILPISCPREKNAAAEYYDNVSYPSLKKAVSDIRRKIIACADHAAQEEITSFPFRGSMMNGIDIRKTMRSLYQKEDQLYVHQRKKCRKKTDSKEPILFIREDLPESNISYDFCSIRIGKNREQMYSAIWQYYYREVLHRQDGYTFYRYRFKGFLVFCEPFRVLEHVKRDYSDEDEFRKRVPLQRIKEPFLLRMERDVLSAKTIPWDEAMFRSAIRYCRETVILVCYPGYKIPECIGQLLKSEGKQLIILSESILTREEQQQFYFGDFSIYGPFGKCPQDRNDVGFMLELEDQFSEIIKTL